MKKYNASTIAEAMKLIRADLGEDAVILNSKVITKKKFFGLKKEKSFEVVAGIDTLVPPPPAVNFTIPEPVRQSATLVQERVHAYAGVQEPTAAPIEKASNNTINEELFQELQVLKNIMQSLQQEDKMSKYSKEMRAFLQYLEQQELAKEHITIIGERLYSAYQEAPLKYNRMEQITKDYLEQRLKNLPYEGIQYDKKYINVLGPTGVGKTTTIAKMAARAVLEQKKKVGFITTDTYRIAAIEQLKTYASLLQAPIEVVYNAEDYKNAIEKLAHVDLIFIDTAGRNFKEAKYVDDLKALINFNAEAQSYLVLSLTSREKDLEKIIEQFAAINIEQFIFTKLDESNAIGTMFNLMIKYHKGTAYYTNGQEVPEDIEQPTMERLFELFFQGEI